MTYTLEHVIDIGLERLAAHPRNVRRSVGDLKDLIRSIRDRGVETPLVVLRADGAGIHHIVAGHRRRVAAETVGLPSVPCIVRDFEDEADVVLCMIAENTQRSDGLNIVDEAQALAAVIELGGGTVSTRKLATVVGHGEGWVRSRLALLSLPDSALDALHAGTITFDVATALTAVAEHPDLVDQLVAQRGLTVWQVDSAHRSLLADLALTDASSALTAAGLLAVTEDDWNVNRSTWKTLDDLRLDATVHRGEPCHAVVVKCRYDGTVVEVAVCTEPGRHRGRNPDSELVVTTTPPSEMEQAATAERRERRRAADARTAWVGERLRNGRQIAAADAIPLAIATWIDSAPYSALQRAVKLLGIDHPDAGYVDYPAILQRHLDAEPKRLATVAVALAAAVAEDRARQSFGSTTVTSYLDTIERLGYQPTDWEHTQRLTSAA